MYLQEDGANGVASVAKACGVVRALLPVLRVDVLGPDEAFFPEGIGVFHDAVQFAQFEVGDFHWAVLQRVFLVVSGCTSIIGRAG